MARFSKVSRATWNDERFRRLTPPRPCGQALWLFLLTNERLSSMPGLMDWGERALAEKLGWSLKGLRKAWQEVEREGMARADWIAGVVSLPNAIKHDPPQSINVVKSWGPVFRELPECQLCRDHLLELKAYVDGMTVGFKEAFREAFPELFLGASRKPSRIPEPEPEPEPEQQPSGPRARPRREQGPRQPAKPRGPAALANDLVLDLVAHHSALFGRTWAWTKRQLPAGDLRRRIAQALDLVGREGAEAGHLGHWLQTKANPKRGGELRHAYPMLEDNDKPSSSRLDVVRYLEQVQLGRDHLADQARRAETEKRLEEEKERIIAEAEAQAGTFDADKLPPWLREAYLRGKEARSSGKED